MAGDQEKGKEIVVDADLCIGCGSCESIAPDYFEIKKDGKSHPKKAYDEKDKEVIEEAVDSCPAGAITIEMRNEK